MNKKVRFVYRGTLLIGFLGAGACLTAMDTQQKQPLIKQEIVDLTEDTEPENQINRLNTVPPVVQLQQQPVHQTKRRSVDDLSPVEIHAITGDIYALVDNQIRRNQEFDYGDIAQLCTTKYHLAFPQTLDGFVLNKLGLQPPNDMLKLGLGGLLKQQQKLRKLIFDYYTSFPRCTQLALCTHLVEKGYVFNKEQIPSLLARVGLDDLIALDDLQQKLGQPQALEVPRDIIPVNENNKNKGVREVTGDHRRGTTKDQIQTQNQQKNSPEKIRGKDNNNTRIGDKESTYLIQVSTLIPNNIRPIIGEIYNYINDKKSHTYQDIALLLRKKFRLDVPPTGNTCSNFLHQQLGLPALPEMAKLGKVGLERQDEALKKYIVEYFKTRHTWTPLELCAFLNQKPETKGFAVWQIVGLLVRAKLEEMAEPKDKGREQAQLALGDTINGMPPPKLPILQFPNLSFTQQNFLEETRNATNNNNIGGKSGQLRSVRELTPGAMRFILRGVYNYINDNKSHTYPDIARFLQTTYGLDVPSTGNACSDFLHRQLGLPPLFEMAGFGKKGLEEQDKALNIYIVNYWLTHRTRTPVGLCAYLNQQPGIKGCAEEKIPGLLVRAALENIVENSPLFCRVNGLNSNSEQVPQGGEISNSISDKKLKVKKRRRLTQEEKDAVTLDLAICIYEKKEKIENDDICAIGGKYGLFLNNKYAPALLRRFGFFSVRELQQFSPERRQNFLEERGFPEDRLRRCTKNQANTLQRVALGGQIENNRIENKRIREKYEENDDIKQAPNGTSGKKRKPVSPQQKKSDYEEMIINPINGGNNDDPTEVVLFEELGQAKQPKDKEEQQEDE